MIRLLGLATGRFYGRHPWQLLLALTGKCADVFAAKAANRVGHALTDRHVDELPAEKPCIERLCTVGIGRAEIDPREGARLVPGPFAHAVPPA